MASTFIISVYLDNWGFHLPIKDSFPSTHQGVNDIGLQWYIATDDYVKALGGKMKELKPLSNTIEVMNTPSKQWILVATHLS